MLAQGLNDRLGVPHVALDEGTPFYELRVTGRKIIETNRRKAGLGESFAAMRSNIAGAAGHQYRRLYAHRIRILEAARFWSPINIA